MELKILSFLLVLHTAASLKKQLTEVKHSKKTSTECQEIACPAVEDPVCMKMKNRNSNKTIYVSLLNKCEMGYMRCHKEIIDGAMVPMKYCDHHHLNTGAQLPHRRRKRHTNQEEEGTKDVRSSISPRIQKRKKFRLKELRNAHVMKGKPKTLRRPKPVKAKAEQRKGPSVRTADNGNKTASKKIADNGDKTASKKAPDNDNKTATKKEFEKLKGEEETVKEIEKLKGGEKTVKGKGLRFVMKGKLKRPKASKPAKAKSKRRKVNPVRTGDNEEVAASGKAGDNDKEAASEKEIEKLKGKEISAESDGVEIELGEDESADDGDAKVKAEDDSSNAKSDAVSDGDVKADPDKQDADDGESENIKKPKDKDPDKEGPSSENEDFLGETDYADKFRGDCPTVCPSRVRLVCAKCDHGVFKTFLSACHVRKFNCEQQTEKMELVSRNSCVYTSPLLTTDSESEKINLEPDGTVFDRDDGDPVLAFIRCRNRNSSVKDGLDVIDDGACKNLLKEMRRDKDYDTK